MTVAAGSWNLITHNIQIYNIDGLSFYLWNVKKNMSY